ncbi:uncharacterized protein MONOS_12314 [Monocercomonoides exilis]|uniref:uncharacterized protein n=1 Tax=Monocercomonoides exilis TaxID=2049356 RepID=UPI00355A2CB2|nr:hypothetical protein MONOS_12314 [Monocercomonoides exilis]|eukprot:MONOS_12314.1-p1 / transcript=MONOS_12314.1 / gene=MONOS_12314 / organism=Monocercomonoides_exilis_PA203 / gene_product=unspecified product / transcript_product=unspecified product / location=Mono_scaffold00674:29497-30561(+) / protein_length=333 / sequence_SO=supercontig / SO=protein_coding / is_pseudo=false
MEDVVLFHAAIALAELEEREEVEEGERRGKEGEEDGEEKGGRERGDGNEEKGGYQTAHRDFVERIKEKQRKLEEAMVLLVVEALGLSWLSTSSAYGIQQEISRAEEEAADGSLGITFDESSDGAVKDVEQVEMSANGLGMNEESGREGSSIDLEKEEEEEGQILDVASLLSVPAHPECVMLVDESAYGRWRDYLVTMTVTGALVELCAEREWIVGKPVVEGMIQPDGTMSVTLIVERLLLRKEKRREESWGGGGCLASDGVSLQLSSDRQRERERMDEFVAIGEVVPQESVPSIALRDATYAIGQVCHGKGMIGVFSVSYCVFVDEWESLRM